jgi:sugar phosphate isomerase/epimerase
MTQASFSRRQFLQTSSAAIAAGLLSPALSFAADKKPLYEISLAEWSFHTALQKKEMDHLDFPKAAADLGIHAIELVNQFFKDKAKDTDYLTEFKRRTDDVGVKRLLIMIDGEGQLGDADDKKRQTAVENHHKWVEAAKFLGCHSIRVNAASSGSYEEQLERAADGLRRLTEFGAQHNINVIVENHGGLSSNGAWLSSVIKKVDLPGCGTLPDFGNFYIDRKANVQYDRYQGVDELMPFAKAVSAKSHDFDEQGNETHTDYYKMMEIVLKHGYHGYVGIEYEGSKLSEVDGIKATLNLLKKVRDKLSA